MVIIDNFTRYFNYTNQQKTTTFKFSIDAMLNYDNIVTKQYTLMV